MAKSKNVETTVEEKLRALFDLQIIHTRLDELKNLRGELPVEVEDLENEIEGLKTRITKREEELEAFDNEVKLKNEVAKNAESLIKKYKGQQDNVRNNREFEALAKEIEFQELEIQLQEKKVKELGVKIESKKEQIEKLQEKLAQLEDHLKHKSSELSGLIKETETEEKFLAGKSDEFEKLIDERLLKSYTKIREGARNGLAIVSIERGTAVGSFFTIPPQVQVEVATRKKIISDEHSGKILVDEYLANEEREKMDKVLKVK